jgi:ATP-dependent helicase/nuclease subunit A
LQQAIQQQQRKSLRQWVEGTWIALGGPACLQQPADIKNTQLFFELLETLDVNTVLEKRNSLEVAVKKLFAMADPDSDEKIQIMTIHKSKGLEFDHVIVPGLEHPSRAPDKDLLKWYERLSEDGHNQLIIAPISAKGKYQNSASASASATKTKSVDATFAHVSAHEKKKERYELCRLLYVACTRAKSRLYLMAQIKPDSKDESLHATPTKGSLLSVIWQPVVSKIIVHKKESDAAEGDIPTSKYSQNESDGALVEALEKEGSTVTYDRAAIDQARPIRRLNSSWCLPSLPEGKLLDPYVPYYQHKNPLDLVDPSTSAVLGSQTPRHVGTLTHRLLQDIGEKGIDVWQQRDLENSADFWRNRLMTMGVPLSELNAAVQQVKCSIAMVLQDKNNAWIFSENNISLRHEYPITVKKGNSANNFIIDLLVETSDATWVIDFKTSQPADQETQECFLEREKSLYQENMRNYKTGIKEMGYSQVKCALYFPLLSALTVYEEN